MEARAVNREWMITYETDACNGLARRRGRYVTHAPNIDAALEAANRYLPHAYPDGVVGIISIERQD
jgi:hypothetical protein